ncbi:MAG: hypothetical protein E6G34_00930 [Actinobacteria bacterium]|nr:MAG: hypothetical protein E6G34_00930 [Actinomycetota bacterium]
MSAALTRQLTAALALTAAIAAGAQDAAARAPSGERVGLCTITAEVASGVVAYGEPATIAGAVACPEGEAAAGLQLTVHQHSAGSPGFSVVGTASIDASNAYSFTSGAIDSPSAFYVSLERSRSPRVRVRATPRISIASSPAAGALLSLSSHRGQSAPTGSRVTFSGAVSPASAGALVTLQREVPGGGERWRPIGLAQTDAEGAYTIARTFHAPGEVVVRAVVHFGGRTLAAGSLPLTYTLLRRQNPRLTIDASAGALAFGQAVTISGTAPGAPNAPVTLLARTGGRGFAPLAVTTTDSTGAYSFAGQVPLQITAYRVSGAGTRSVTVREAVHPVLSEAVSSASAPAGSPLAFSGTLTPAHEGELVLLERANPSGLSFHVVDSARVGAGSTYSITHTFLYPGSARVRIAVRRDSELQSVVTESRVIQVTPPLRSRAAAFPEALAAQASSS